MAGTSHDKVTNLVLLFTSLLTIPLARQCCFDAALFAGLQVIGMTFYFLDDVFLLYLALKPAQCIFKRFAFLQANLGQRVPPPNLPEGPMPIIANGGRIIQLGKNPRILKDLSFAAEIENAEYFPNLKQTIGSVNPTHVCSLSGYTGPGV